jgi:hypothetical protein
MEGVEESDLRLVNNLNIRDKKSCQRLKKLEDIIKELLEDGNCSK